MEYRNIKSPFYTEKYVVENTYHDNVNGTFVINLENARYNGDTARISFNKVLCIRFTPLKLCISEYCDDLYAYVKGHPGFMDTYSGIMEIVDCDKLKDKTTFAKASGYKHYFIMTEDEYVEVLAENDPIIEMFNSVTEEAKVQENC